MLHYCTGIFLFIVSTENCSIILGFSNVVDCCWSAPFIVYFFILSVKPTYTWQHNHFPCCSLSFFCSWKLSNNTFVSKPSAQWLNYLLQTNLEAWKSILKQSSIPNIKRIDNIAPFYTSSNDTNMQFRNVIRSININEL